jgi:signal transduction histidine kinase
VALERLVDVERSSLMPEAARRLLHGSLRVFLRPADHARDPVRYSPPLVAYVTAVVTTASAVGALTVQAPRDGLTLAAGTVAAFLLALYVIKPLTAVQTTWTASAFINLGLTVTLGPVGAAAAGLAEAAGVGLRTRNGWVRTLFNACNHFLANMAAWYVFATLQAHAGRAPALTVLIGIAAGITQFVADHVVLSVVLRIANPDSSLARILSAELSVVGYSVGYGWAVYAFVVMEGRAGALGFMSVLVPLGTLHGFTILFARRVRAYEQQRAAHQREREELLQKAVDASESERRRIARDLHDGVVQNLAGMAFTLMATASQLKEDASSNGEAELIEVLEQSAKETRSAMKDLRTLIIEIAPPTLRREGLHAALLEVLRTLNSAGTDTQLELPSNMRLRPDRASLIFRVAQEVLRNVAAHAEAKHVSVVLKESGSNAVLRIVDDGKGFSAADVARRRAEGHVGTNAIVELAEEVGGSLDIDSAPGKGTRVTLTVPTE